MDTESRKPFSLSQGVTEAARRHGLSFQAHGRLLSQQDILTFADLLAEQRAKRRGDPYPNEDDYFIGLAWTCVIPWGPPKKPPDPKSGVSERLNFLIQGAYTNPAKRDRIIQSFRQPLLHLSKGEMEQREYEVTDMLDL
jgi:hypothetical protein